MKKAHKLGRKGEDIASHFLAHKKHQIIDRNWRWQKAEIDIIAEHNKQVVFIEVKTRRSSRFGNPSEFVSNKKQELMRDAAEAYLEQYNLTNEIRFNIIGIILNSRDKKIEHIQNAF